MRPDRLVAPALGALWTQRARLGFAWDVLRHGACSDCSLGASGMHDAHGSHLCARRLARLTRETALPFPPHLLSDVAPLLSLSRRALRGLGRIPTPMLRRAGAPGFTPLSWNDAAHLASSRLRDDRGESSWGMRIDPLNMDLESLFQLGRFAVAMERRHEEQATPLLDLAVPDAERRLRARARDTLGHLHATSTTAAVALQPGDSVLVVSDGDQPLLPEFVAPLTARGVLVHACGPDDDWPTDVRHVLLFGRAGTVAALAAGIPLHRDAATAQDLDAIYLVGAAHCVGQESVPIRIHQAAHLDPGMLAPAPEAVLLMPASPPSDTPGGGTHLSDDLVARFSPAILDAPRSDARPHWEIPVLVAALADPGLGERLAAHDASELRSALASARSGLAGVLGLSRAGDSFVLPAPLP